MNDLKAYLEELMDVKRSVTVKFRTVDGGVAETEGHIVKMDSVSGRDMAELDSGLIIGTDQMLEVAGRRFQNLC